MLVFYLYNEYVEINPQIFRAYDIRGEYGEDFDGEFVEELGAKLGTKFKKLLVIGRDGRKSSPEIQKLIVRGAKSAGAHIVDIGQCTTPLFYFSVRQIEAAGGVMVTASHNPGEYNGFKVVGPESAILGGQEIEKIFQGKAGEGRGAILEENYLEKYVEKILELADLPALSEEVSVDCSEAGREILSELASQTRLKFVYSKHAPLHVAFDADGDRINFYENRQKIEPELIFALLAEHEKYKKVVYDFRFSRSVRQGTASRVGRLFMYEAMKKNKAQFGAEMSGHFYFKDLGYLDAPELVLCLVLKIMQLEDKTLTELVKPYQKFFKSEEINFKYKEDVFAKLKEHYAGAKTEEADGLTVDLWKSGWWFNLRPSNTEPLMRLIVEAKTKDLLDEKVSELKELIKD